MNRTNVFQNYKNDVGTVLISTFQEGTLIQIGALIWIGTLIVKFRVGKMDPIFLLTPKS